MLRPRCFHVWLSDLALGADCAIGSVDSRKDRPGDISLCRIRRYRRGMDVRSAACIELIIGDEPALKWPYNVHL